MKQVKIPQTHVRSVWQVMGLIVVLAFVAALISSPNTSTIIGDFGTSFQNIVGGATGKAPK